MQKSVFKTKTLWTAIGVGAGVAAYLFGTEHGRRAQRRIGKTLKESFTRVRDTVEDQVNTARWKSEVARMDDLRPLN